MGKKKKVVKRVKKLDYRHDKCKFCGGIKLKNSPMCRDCFVKKRKNSSVKKPKIKIDKSAKIRHWIIQQKKDVQKMFAPQVDYDKEYDILYITWFPKLRCKYSMECESDFIFDLTDNDYIKGVEIMDFKKRFLKDAKPKPNKAKRRK